MTTKTANADNRRILIVDDNHSIHDDFRKILACESDGHELEDLENEIFGRREAAHEEAFMVDSAFQGLEGLSAIERAKKHGHPYSVAFVDVRMPPGLDGIETAERILRADRDINVVLCTAYSDHSTQDMLNRFGRTDRVTMLKKPFDVSEVTLAAVSLSERWNRELEKNRIMQQQSQSLVRAQGLVARSRIDEDSEAVPKYELVEFLKQEALNSVGTQQAALVAMAALVEPVDPGIGSHLRRIRKLTQVLAEELALNSAYSDQIDAQFLLDLARSAPLHDIGKLAIPDGILLKPGRLTQEEREIMKQHTVLGAQALEFAAEQAEQSVLPRMSIDVARHHHEQFDGSGYPDGLVGTQIPLAARIVALADVYDAVTTKRVYKDAQSPQTAREIIRSEKGGHFDPVIVEAFDQRFSEIVADSPSVARKSSEQELVRR